MPPPLALKLRHFRWQRRLGVAPLARGAGLPTSTIRALEAGRRTPSAAELRALARFFGRRPAFLLSDDGTLFTHRLRRAPLSQESKRALNVFEQACLDLLRGRRRAVPIPPLYRPPTRSESRTFDGRIDYARRLAEEERRRLRLGKGPIRDLYGVLSRAGAPVVEIPLREIDGAAYFDPRYGCFILVNRSMPLARRRFAAAHQYLHHLKDRMEGLRYDKPGEIHWPVPGRSLMVTISNAFAAAFLKP